MARHSAFLILLVLAPVKAIRVREEHRTLGGQSLRMTDSISAEFVATKLLPKLSRSDPSFKEWKQWFAMTTHLPSFYKSGPKEEISLMQFQQRSGKIAVLTSGTLKRYLLESATRGLLEPLVKNGYEVDYFLALDQADFHSLRQDGDNLRPQIYGIDQYTSYQLVNDTVQSVGANPRHIDLYNDLELNQEIQSNFIKNAGISEETDRNNMLRRFFKYQELKNVMEKQEDETGAYDWVIMVDDDALWIRPMNFPRLLEASPVDDLQCGKSSTKSSSRAFNLKCQHNLGSTYDPGCNGFTDYVFILDRKAAHTFMSQYNLLLHGTHAGRTTQTPEKYWTGNVEKFAMAIALDNEIEMVSVPAQLIPMSRGGHVTGNKFHMEMCLHKTCDSQSEEFDALNPEGLYKTCY